MGKWREVEVMATLEMHQRKQLKHNTNN